MTHEHSILARVAVAALVAAVACSGSGSSSSPSTGGAPAAHSSTMALSADGSTLYVANPESDTVSVVDVKGRTLVQEILLAQAAPAPDPTTGAFAPAVQPRTVALSPDT
jgi:YVTN family beta-propeller protein